MPLFECKQPSPMSYMATIRMWLCFRIPYTPLIYMEWRFRDYNGHSVHAVRQWETTLHCNVVSYWLDAYTEWSASSTRRLTWYIINDKTKFMWCGLMACRFGFTCHANIRHPKSGIVVEMLLTRCRTLRFSRSTYMWHSFRLTTEQ